MVSREREMRAVFVFYEDGSGVDAYGSLEELRAEIEAIDVETGEYAFFTVEGLVVEAVVKGWAAQDLDLQVTTTDGSQVLRERLTIELPRVGLDAALAESPLAAAQALVDARWEARWPRRPAWLDRRLHGSRPVLGDKAGL